MLFHQAFQIFVFLLGIFSCSLSIGLCSYFLRSRNRLGRAVGWMLFGEAVTGACTLIFASSAMINGIAVGRAADIVDQWNHWNSMTPHTASCLRVAMFSVTALTSIHLARVVVFVVRDIYGE